MKKIIKNTCYSSCIISMLCILSFTGCKDDEIQLAPEGSSTENQIVEGMNTNLSALQKLIAAKVNGTNVESCVQISTSDYRVELSDGNSFTFLTSIGAIGNQEGSVYYPTVTAMEYGETYYWTLDGKYLTSGGNKIEVTDGVTPSVGISDSGYWTVTCGSETQTLSHSVENGTIKSLFDGVDQTDSDEIKFILRGDLQSLSLTKTEADSGEDIKPTYNLRRPISPDHPAWLIHIDTWNYPDPQAIIDLIPEDIKPYVIFNISLSISHDEDTGQFKVVEYGYETAKSWLRACAENNVWAMVQPASGGFCHFPDYSNYAEISSESSVYKEFYTDYPNFLGFNYAEQFWGFDDKFSVTYPQRLQHWTNLMQLSNEYGGYLVISFCGTGEWSAGLAPMAMLKKDANLAAICKKCPENLIVCEKFTSTAGFFDIESACLGTWLSGYAGQYGMRFDVCGWPDDKVWNGDAGFQTPAGAIPMIEHIMFTGQTVYDGPELIWTEDFKEVSAGDAGDGYSTRRWERYPQFDNINIDIYRKIIDGTIRIMSRKEVIDRTKFIVINDIAPTGGTFDPGYLTPETLFEGLYRLDNDGNYSNNIIYFKKTGRYPTIPMAMDLADDLANSFEYQINASQFSAGWDDIKLKQGKFNRVFPEEYTGDLYAGRYENGWVVYNPLADVTTASIPFKYNTCEKMELSYAKYTSSVIKEFSNKVKFYLTNYSEEGKLVTDVIKIYGSNDQPTFTYNNRVAGNTCNISKQWSDGIYTLSVEHNGAVDIEVSCQGDATDRETEYTTSTISKPITPKEYWGSDYTGPRQYEAECFQYKNINQVIASASSGDIRYYTGQGYLNFGTSSGAAVRDYTNVPSAGNYRIIIKYIAKNATVNSVSLYVNGEEICQPSFTQTAAGEDQWQTVSTAVSLKEGENKIELKATETLATELYFDNFVIEKIN